MKKLQWAKEVIECESFWVNLFTITQAVFPALRVLRLADRSNAGMRMLYNFSRMAKKAISSRKDDLNKITRMGPFKEVDTSDSDRSSDDSTGDEDIDSDNKKNKQVNVSGMKLGDCVVNLWATRSWCIRSDFAVTG